MNPFDSITATLPHSINTVADPSGMFVMVTISKPCVSEHTFDGSDIVLTSAYGKEVGRYSLNDDYEVTMVSNTTRSLRMLLRSYADTAPEGIETDFEVGE